MPKNEYSELDQALDAIDVDTNFFEDEPETSHEEQQQQQHEPVSSESDPLTNPTPTATTATFSGDEEATAISTKYLVMGFVVLVTLGVVVTVVTLLPSWLLIMTALALVTLLVLARVNIPSRESFHVQQEMQRLKQKKQETKSKAKTSWLGKKAAAAKSVLSTTTKKAVGGYDDVLFMDVGIGRLAAVRDLTNGKCYTWVGLWKEWRCVVHLMSAETNARLHRWLWNHRHGSTRS